MLGHYGGYRNIVKFEFTYRPSFKWSNVSRYISQSVVGSRSGRLKVKSWFSNKTRRFTFMGVRRRGRAPLDFHTWYW